MKRYEILFTPKAQEDLYNIIFYISVELGSPLTASRLFDRLTGGIDGIGSMPYAWPRLADDGRYFSDLRRRIIDNYQVIYRCSDSTETVTILRVFHTLQDILGALDEELGE